MLLSAFYFHLKKTCASLDKRATLLHDSINECLVAAKKLNNVKHQRETSEIVAEDFLYYSGLNVPK